MRHEAILDPAFVIKAEELPALNYLGANHPRPLLMEWINRGTNQKMRPTTIDQLLRTLDQADPSPSVARLHDSAGLRVIFRTGKERDLFTTAFAGARARLNIKQQFQIAAIFDGLEAAERAVTELRDAGIPDSAISLLRRAGEYSFTEGEDWRGHSRRSVATAVAGGGIAGALLGIGILAMIPGVGPVAAAGAIVAQLSSVASLSAIFGATGGAMAKMLTDHDVDGREANYFERQIRLGRVFVSVDTRIANGQSDIARRILRDNGGRNPGG
jgi:hypothetical protein